MSKNVIIGTAGHIDHGKTTLIKALTGKDTDRLLVEKQRGISIESAFTHLENKETQVRNLNLGIIDVPGHQKFVNKMLAAAGGIDLALIVVAADEGVMPQTKEHLSILELMGTKSALIVINKIDLVDKEWLALIKLDILDQFSGTFADNAEILEVSAVKDQGIKKLKNKIIELAAKIKINSTVQIPYYPIDRVFSLKGQGTIVTGTLFTGEFYSGQELYLYPKAKKIKIKGMENHRKKIKRANSGSRVGINLSYPDKNEIRRGDVISTAESLLSTKYVEAKLKILDSINFRVTNGDRVHFYAGANEVMGTINIYGRKEAFPGEEIFIKIKLEQKISPYYRQKFVLRRFSPLQTIGGGEILEIDPPPRRKKDSKEVINHLNLLNEITIKDTLELFIKNQTITYLNFLKKKTSLKTENILSLLSELKAADKIVELKTDYSFIHHDNFNDLADKISKVINDYHQQHRLKLGIPREEIRSRLTLSLSKKELDKILNILFDKNLLIEKKHLVALRNFNIKLTDREKKQKEYVINKIRENYFAPPGRKELLAENQELESIIDYLEQTSELIRLDQDLYFDKNIFLRIRIILQDYFKTNKTIELSEFRDLLDSSRKYALVLLEKCDQLQLTVRRGDIRYPGNKL